MFSIRISIYVSIYVSISICVTIRNGLGVLTGRFSNLELLCHFDFRLSHSPAPADQHTDKKNGKQKYHETDDRNSRLGKLLFMCDLRDLVLDLVQDLLQKQLGGNRSRSPRHQSPDHQSGEKFRTRRKTFFRLKGKGTGKCGIYGLGETGRMRPETRFLKEYRRAVSRKRKRAGQHFV